MHESLISSLVFHGVGLGELRRRRLAGRHCLLVLLDRPDFAIPASRELNLGVWQPRDVPSDIPSC